MPVLKTTSPPTDPAPPNARPDISVPSSSRSFIATGSFMRGPLIEPSREWVEALRPPGDSLSAKSECGEKPGVRNVSGADKRAKNQNIQVVISTCRSDLRQHRLCPYPPPRLTQERQAAVDHAIEV